MGCFDSCGDAYYKKNSKCRKVTWIVIGTTLGTILLIISFTLLGISFKRVEQTEYGIAYYNTTTMEFGDTYEQGVYPIAPGAEMMIFTRTLQDVDTGDIICFSSDKIVIVLTIAVQYQLVKDDIISIILKKYGGNDKFENVFKYIVQNIIINRCGQYTAEDYYVHRAIIDEDMYKHLLDEVNSNNVGATIQLFQLTNIKFPPAFSEVISEKQITIQNAITTLNQRASQLIAANTTLLEAQRTANIILINANNTARINLQQAESTSNVIYNQWYQRGLAYASVKTSLGLDENQFIEYLKNEIIRTAPHAVISV